MPELPEVETTRRGLAAVLPGRRIARLVVREPRLRERVPRGLGDEVRGRRVERLARRGKYLLVHLDRGALLVHLGMSGSLRLATPAAPLLPHDRWILAFEDGTELRLHDPRRFSLLRPAPDAELDGLLRDLGPEPLETPADDLARHLRDRARGRRLAVKSFLMDGRVVAGVGNIYASEALFRAGVRPGRAAGRVRPAEWTRLVRALRAVLEDALECGGSTLRDYLAVDGRPGHFRLRLDVYGRGGEDCRRCGGAIRTTRIGGRGSFYCPRCQR